MNLLDILILLPIAWFAFKGFTSGLVKEVLSIVGIILAVFITFRYMDAVSVLLTPFFEEGSDYMPLIAGLVLFIGTLSIVHFIAFLTKKFLETIKLNALNKALGLIFGALKCGLVISGILLLMAGFNLPGEESRQKSLLYPYIIHLAPGAYNLVAAVYPGTENFITTIENTLQENNPLNNLPNFK
jgi:membrane protein required for colicin V production